MNLRQLEHLVALADEGSFARAAERIHLSQPALTRSIQALEEELTIQLCDRHPRGITLTPGGKMVVERARRVLFESRALDRDVNLFKNHEMGDVSFGVGPYPAAVLLPDAIAMLAQSYPSLSVRTEVNNWNILLDQLRSEKIDFLILERRAVAPSEDLAIQLLSRCECGWFARPGHPIFKKEEFPFTILRNAQLASVPMPSFLHDELRKMLRCKPTEALNIHVECNSFFALKHLAEQSDMLVYGTLSSVRRELEEGRLRRIEFDDKKEFFMRFAVVHLAHRTVSPMTERAIAAIIECDKKLNSGVCAELSNGHAEIASA